MKAFVQQTRHLAQHRLAHQDCQSGHLGRGISHHVIFIPEPGTEEQRLTREEGPGEIRYPQSPNGDGVTQNPKAHDETHSA